MAVHDRLSGIGLGLHEVADAVCLAAAVALAFCAVVLLVTSGAAVKEPLPAWL
jgi:hypothetical protein